MIWEEAEDSLGGRLPRECRGMLVVGCVPDALEGLKAACLAQCRAFSTDLAVRGGLHLRWGLSDEYKERREGSGRMAAFQGGCGSRPCVSRLCSCSQIQPAACPCCWSAAPPCVYGCLQLRLPLNSRAVQC